MSILLAVKDQTRKKFYHDIISGHGLDCCIVGSLQEAITHAYLEPHSGILIDMQLMIKVPKSIIDGVEDLQSGLPSATLNIHKSSESIRILSRGELSSGCSSLEQFIERCTQFNPKVIYSRARELIYYNILLDRTPDFKDPHNKSVCLDISPGGCFIFCTWEEVVVGDSVWIKLPETVKPSPVKAIVCWIRKWGISQDMPGIGVRFCE